MRTYHDPPLHARRLGRGATALVVLAMLATGPAGWAQGSDLVSLQVAVRPWFGPGTPLHVTATVTNPSGSELRDLRVTVSVHRRVRSRSDLHRALDRGPVGTPLEASSHRVDELGAGEATTVEITEDLAARGGFYAAPDGVYPLVVTLGKAGEDVLRQARTAVALVSEPPPTPLRSLLVLRVTPLPLTHPADPDDRRSLQRLEGVHERLSRLTAAGPVAASVSPVLLTELEMLRERAPDLTDDVIQRLRELAGEELLRTPFTNVRLPQVPDIGSTVQQELLDGAAASSRVLGQEPTGPVLPPDLAVDPASLEALRRMGVPAVVVDPSQVSGGSTLTRANPISLQGVTAVPADATITDRASRARTALDVGHVMAETAMVFFESPGRPRTLALVLDALGPRTPELVEAVRAAPWLRPIGPEELGPPEAGQPAPATAETAPPAAYLQALGRARSAVSAFESFTMPDHPDRRRMRLW
ncbi:MAG TPA: DUF6049 family protein, partial [Actinomycetota bacterium]|nr:DUF6049 family protein [Actinomycetota bacterium]